MKNPFLSVVVSALVASGLAHGQVIISDSFTGSDGTLITSHSPDVNTPGSAYVGTPNFGPINPTDPTDTPHNVPEIQNNQLQFDATSAAAINITSANGYTKPSTLTISANLNEGGMSGIGGQSNFVRGLALGFYNSSYDPSTSGEGNLQKFSGVVLNAFNGDMDLFYPNGGTSTSQAPFIAYDSTDLGAFSTSTDYSLSYTIDTTSGLITSLSLSDSTGTATYSGFTLNAPSSNPPTLAIFTDADTTYASVSAFTYGGAGELSYADNFQLSGPETVPEPSTWALMLGSFAALGFVLRRRTR